jgi:hypothetical protein
VYLISFSYCMRPAVEEYDVVEKAAAKDPELAAIEKVGGDGEEVGKMD